MYRQRARRNVGNAMAEMPGAFILLIIGLLLPLISLITLSYRTILLYAASRDASYQASIADSYSEGVTNARNALQNSTSRIGGVVIDTTTQPVVEIVIKKLADGTETVKDEKLAAGTVNTQLNQYFIRTTIEGDVNSLICFPPGSFWGAGIPGLTQPIHVDKMTYQVFAENPNGLES